MSEKALYLGLDPAHWKGERILVHIPFIKIVPKSLTDPLIEQALKQFSNFTHVVITSKSSVKILHNFLLTKGIPLEIWADKQTAVVGRSTAIELEAYGIKPDIIAEEETAEGVVKALKKMDLESAHFFWPRSSRARTVINDFFYERGVPFTACPLYDTVTSVPDPLPRIEDFKEVIFTSPSTVDAFLAIYGKFPSHLLLTPIGPVTANYLDSFAR